MKIPLRTVLLLAVAASGGARAQTITYQTTIPEGSIASASGDSVVQFYGTDSQANVTANGTGIVLANLVGYSSSNQGESIHGNYTLALKLTDGGGNTASTQFTGALDGFLGASGSNLFNTFHDPTSQKVTLGGNAFDVTIERFTAPGGFMPGSISGSIKPAPVVGPLPFTMADVAQAVNAAAGFVVLTQADVARLDVETTGTSQGVVDVSDAVRLLRKVAATDPNP